jgi:ABC-type transport system involved in Fe-S cluster assembly fused permease/ATPase subunit
MASAKQKSRKNKYQEAAQAAKRKRTIAHLPKSVRTALGKQGAKIARQKRASR